MNLQSCIIKSIPNCICIRFLRCLVRTHESLHPTRNNYQRTFPTLGCRVFVSISSLQTVLATDKPWPDLRPTRPPFHLTKQAAESRFSSEPLARWRRVISTLITAPLLRTDSAGRRRCCCCLWSPAVLSKHWCAATAPLCGETSKNVHPVSETGRRDSERGPCCESSVQYCVFVRVTFCGFLLYYLGAGQKIDA